MLPRSVIGALQRRLTELKFAPGPADGIWGAKGAKAYAAFCRSRQIPVGNRLTREHIKALWDLDFDPRNATSEESVEFLRKIGGEY